MIKPEKRGICGNYTWHDARIISTHHPRGPFRAVKKKQCLDPERGEWRGVNEAVRELSCGRTDRWSAYSILDHPETSCRCGECMAAIIPEAQGFMIAHHDYRGLTPAGFTYAELLETAGRGRQVPGFMGFDETFPLSRRFMGAEGGLSRIVWMPAELKEKLRHAAMGTPGECDLLPLIGRAADETDADTLRDLLKFLEHTHHPALSMPALF
jgi:CO dehydrogenase/acetyl-CoA synthase beta subunit